MMDRAPASQASGGCMPAACRKQRRSCSLKDGMEGLCYQPSPMLMLLAVFLMADLTACSQVDELALYQLVSMHACMYLPHHRMHHASL